MGHRIAVLNTGRLQQLGTPMELYQWPAAAGGVSAAQPPWATGSKGLSLGDWLGRFGGTSWVDRP